MGDRHFWRRWILRAVVALLMIAVYVTVLILYGISATPEVVDKQDFSGDIDVNRDLIVVVSPINIEPAGSSIPARLEILPPARYTDDAGALTKSIDVVMPALATGSVKFDKGTTQTARTVDLVMSEGDYQTYPFDQYETILAAASYVIEANGQRRPLRTVLGAGGSTPGWTVENAPIPGLGAGLGGQSLSQLEIRRAGSTIAIVLLLLVAMAILAATAVFVSAAVVRRRRRIEATMASWFAALLFAIIPLRTNMPGSPPIGAWLDFVVVLWVELTLMVTLAVFIGSWLAVSARPDKPVRTGPPEAR